MHPPHSRFVSDSFIEFLTRSHSPGNIKHLRVYFCSVNTEYVFFANCGAAASWQRRSTPELWCNTAACWRRTGDLSFQFLFDRTSLETRKRRQRTRPITSRCPPPPPSTRCCCCCCSKLHVAPFIILSTTLLPSQWKTFPHLSSSNQKHAVETRAHAHTLIYHTAQQPHHFTSTKVLIKLTHINVPTLLLN